MKYKNLKILSIAQQGYEILNCYPNFKISYSNRVMNCFGIIKPTDISKHYDIKIKYSLKKSPDIWIIKPELKQRSGDEKIPHIYSKNRLCVYHPKKDEWSRGNHIAHTIIPWTSLWLFYYEIWLATGEWLGEGEHPEIESDCNKKDEHVL